MKELIDKRLQIINNISEMVFTLVIAIIGYMALMLILFFLVVQDAAIPWGFSYGMDAIVISLFVSATVIVSYRAYQIYIITRKDKSLT